MPTVKGAIASGSAFTSSGSVRAAISASSSAQ